ncbi:MAG: pyridoxal-phosphate dependent enzyme, partial [Cyanobacteria bacterium]|nr:pyridoxal-phosphate dependent enzyme [Cyanobacteriota bacterium]
MPGFVDPLVLEKNRNLDLSFQAGSVVLEGSSKTSSNGNLGQVSFDGPSLTSLSPVSVWDQLETPSIQAAFQKIKAASLILERVLKTEAPLTPLDPSQMMGNLLYKREDLTLTKAYKLRGAVVGMAYALETLGYQKFLTVSTGNHALGVLKAAELLKPQQIRLVVPLNTSPYKL